METVTYTIYALVDPQTHQVRYVGQTRQTLAQRFNNHCMCADKGYPDPVYEWMRSLAPAKPFPVMLQQVEEVVRIVPTLAREHKAHAAEVKWMKRFERFNLLQFVEQKRAAYRRLVNPWEDVSSEG